MSNSGTDINKAIFYLQRGELVAIPTETVYGLAANAFDANAVLKIYEAKKRPSFNPLIIHSSSIEKFESWGLVIPSEAKRLMQQYSPGPITCVIHANEQIPDIVTAGTKTVGIRIPNHPLTLRLLEQLDFPLAAPSANLSGTVSPTSVKHVISGLGDVPSYILDGGDCTIGVESTVISFLEDTPTLLRYGGLSPESITAFIPDVNILQSTNDSNPVSPGQLTRHYATRHKLIVGDVESLLQLHNPARTGVISFSTVYNSVSPSQQFVLSAEQNLTEAASNLFPALHSLNEMEIDVILAEVFPHTGLGFAINDRLKRASVSE